MIAIFGWLLSLRSLPVPWADGFITPKPVLSGERRSSSPLLTVVMATLNAAADLPGSLGSLAAQCSRDFEVVLVDGGSSDQTCQQAEHILEAACIPYRIVVLPDSGIYGAINHGVAEAQGDWIYVMGADDRLMTEGVLAAVAPVLQSTKRHILVVHGDVWIEDPGYRYGQPWDWPRFLDRNISHQSAFYRRQPIELMGIKYNERYALYADWDYNLKIFARGEFYYFPLLVASYACTGASSGRVDQLFLAEKERNARRYLGWRSLFLMPPHRFSLSSKPRSGLGFRAQLLLNRFLWALKRFKPRPHGSS
jgi:glycosyltransferase involved in cell wall biosynthesis